MVTLLDQVSLTLTAVWGIIYLAYSARAFMRTRSLQYVLWMGAIVALLVVASTLLLFDFAGLQLPYTTAVGMFIPGLFAAGILSAGFRSRHGAYYALYVTVVTIAYLILKWAGGPYLLTLLAVHVPSSLIIITIPSYAAGRGSKFLFLTSVGGALISVAGVALAALAAGFPIFPPTVVLSIAAPIIFSSAFLMTLGLMLTKGWTLRSQREP
jgi:hypothetical protein